MAYKNPNTGNALKFFNDESEARYGKAIKAADDIVYQQGGENKASANAGKKPYVRPSQGGAPVKKKKVRRIKGAKY